MKHRLSHSLSLVSLMLIFCLPFLFCTEMAGADGGQDLGIKLVGTAIGDEPREAFAILKVLSTGGQGAFREGDRLDDIRIKKIMPGYVVIETRMGEVTLSLGPGEKPGDLASIPETTRLERREVYSKLPEYKHLMEAIRVRPRFEGVEPAGVIIYKIEPGSIFARMGLKDGDLIVAVNGRSIATTRQAEEFYAALKDGGTVALGIRRRERRMELHFEIQ